MDIDLPEGTYIVAVSGGVDSMALLNMLAKQKRDRHYIVAHFDHGIRDDSHIDRKLVEDTARRYGLNFIYDRAELGYGASEAVARQARYTFLRKVRAAARADAIITAHHEDDALETAVINLLRGTNRRGLSSLGSKQDVVRPLLRAKKSDLISYAQANGLVWREDSTNTDPRYLRNNIRQSYMQKLAPADRKKLVDIVHRMHTVNDELDMHLTNYLHLQPSSDKLSRHDFILLPHSVAREVMAAWLRAHGIRTYDRKMLERLIVAAKTFAPDKVVDVQNGYKIHVNVKFLALVRTGR